jgi:hypothetical protein
VRPPEVPKATDGPAWLLPPASLGGQGPLAALFAAQWDALIAGLGHELGCEPRATRVAALVHLDEDGRPPGAQECDARPGRPCVMGKDGRCVFCSPSAA